MGQDPADGAACQGVRRRDTRLPSPRRGDLCKGGAAEAGGVSGSSFSRGGHPWQWRGGCERWGGGVRVTAFLYHNFVVSQDSEEFPSTQVNLWPAPPSRCAPSTGGLNFPPRSMFSSQRSTLLTSTHGSNCKLDPCFNRTAQKLVKFCENIGLGASRVTLASSIMVSQMNA